MANGKKNYFRHSFFAGNDPKIVELISNHGKQAYFHFFRLLELCGQQAEEEVPEKFVFHARTLCAELLVTRSRLGHHLLAMQSSLLLHYVLTDSKVEILVPNLAKYLGKYTNKNPSNMPNKRKEKEIKSKEIKVKIEAEQNPKKGRSKRAKAIPAEIPKGPIWAMPKIDSDFFATLLEFVSHSFQQEQSEKFGIDVIDEELKKIRKWAVDNPRKWEKKVDYEKFLENWFQNVKPKTTGKAIPKCSQAMDKYDRLLEQIVSEAKVITVESEVLNDQ